MTSTPEFKQRAAESALLRFLVVGALNTGLGYLLFRGFLRVFGGGPRVAGLAQAAAYAAGVAISYRLNRGWAFRSDAAHRAALPRFLAAHLGALLLSTGLIQLAVTVGMAPTPAWIGAVAATTIFNFVAQRYWVFSPA